MEGAVAGEVENAHTFTLQVHTHTVGVDGPLSFSDLPVLTTLGELKTKIKDRVSPISAEETHQRLIHRGRYLREDGATMKELFGEDELRAHSTQSLHLAIRPKDDEAISQSPAQIQNPPRQMPARIQIQRNSSVPQYPSVLPYLPPPLSSQLNTINTHIPRQNTQTRLQSASQHFSDESRPMVYILSSPEGPRGILISDISTFHTPQSRAAPENEESTSAGPSDPSSEAPPPRDPDNIIAAADEAASSFPEVLSPEIAMQYAADGFRHQMKCIYDFQLAKVRVNSAEMTADNTRRPWAQRADARARLMEAQGEMLEAHSRAMRVSEAYLQINRRLPLHTEGDDEIRLKTAHRLGLHHLHAQSQLFRLHDQPRELEAFKPEAQRAFEQYLEAVMEVTPILSGMHIPAIHGDFEARTMLQSMQRIRQPDQPAAARETVARIVRQGRRRRQDAAAPIPELGHGHGINRPLMAVALAQLFPHLWLLFKLCIFLYAFTRVDDSWTQIITMVSIALGILLYNVGALETLWARLMAHLHGLLPMHDIDAAPAQQIGGAVAGRGEAAAAAAILGNDPPPIGRDRAATITPEIYAAQLLRRQQEAQNQNRSWLGERVRAIEHSVLLFITSIVPGVGEGHIQARNNEIRARRRAEEERVANEAALAVPLEAENATPQQSSGDGGALASGASVGESSSQAVRRNVAGDGGGDQEEENPQPTRTQPMEAYVEDEFGVVE